MERDEALLSQDNIKLIINKRMSETGITAYKISKATGISQGQLSEWFNGKTNITLYKFMLFEAM